MTKELSIGPALRIEGELDVPGDKSISHRALIVAAMAEGEMPIRGLAPAADVTSTLHAVRSLTSSGINSHLRVDAVSTSTFTRDFQVFLAQGGVNSWASPREPLDVGNSGTTIRTLLGPLAGSSVDATLTGDESILSRPMGRVVEPLRRMGARIEGQEGGDRAPLRVQGTRLHGGAHELSVASAQVKTALLLAGLLAEGETTVREPAQSRDHTERLLRYLGVPIPESTDGLRVKSISLQGASLTIPGDLSSAAFLLVAAALLPGSDVALPNVGLNPTRTGIIDILRAFGASIELSEQREECGEPRGTIRIRPGDRRPLEITGSLTVRALDELPLIAVLGSAAEGTTVVRDAAELRVKESDRIATIVHGLTQMGADIEPTPDGFVVRGPSRLHGNTVDGADDHRIAMALAVAALTADEGTLIQGWDAVGVSYPRFEQDLDGLVVR